MLDAAEALLLGSRNQASIDDSRGTRVGVIRVDPDDQHFLFMRNPDVPAPIVCAYLVAEVCGEADALPRRARHANALRKASR